MCVTQHFSGLISFQEYVFFDTFSAEETTELNTSSQDGSIRSFVGNWVIGRCWEKDKWRVNQVFTIKYVTFKYNSSWCQKCSKSTENIQGLLDFFIPSYLKVNVRFIATFTKIHSFFTVQLLQLAPLKTFWSRTDVSQV